MANFFTRLGKSILDIGSDLLYGASKAIEGIVDLGIGAVGTVGGWFDDDFEKDVKDFVSYDIMGEGARMNKLRELAEKDSYLEGTSVGDFIDEVAVGIGNMLPSVAVSFIPGVGPALGLATLGAGAAGNASEEAINDGAELDEALGYGIVRGATEIVTEKALGGATKYFTGGGKAALKAGAKVATEGAEAGAKSLGKVATTGIKRVGQEMLEEAGEEVASELLNPVSKTIYKGSEALSEYGESEYWRGVGKAGLAGAATSVAYGGTVGKLTKTSGKYADVAGSVAQAEELQAKKSKMWRDGTLTKEADAEINDYIKKNYEQASEILKKAKPGQRATMLKRYNRDGKTVFDNDGSLNKDFSLALEQRLNGAKVVYKDESGEKHAVDAPDKRYYSEGLVGDEARIMNELAKNGTKIYSGELDDVEQTNFNKVKAVHAALTDKGLINTELVLSETMIENNGYLDGRTVVIGKDKLTDGGYVDTVIHEVAHFTEGSAEYKAYAEHIIEQVSDERITEIAELNGIEAKTKDELIELVRSSDKPGKDTLISELVASESARLFDSDASVRRLARSNEGLARKILNRIRDFIDVLLAKTPDERAAIKQLMKQERLFEAALKMQGREYAEKHFAEMKREAEEEVNSQTSGNFEGERDASTDADDAESNDDIQRSAKPRSTVEKENAPEGAVQYERKSETTKSQKITAGMSDDERFNILKNRKIVNVKKVTAITSEIKNKVPELSSWEDINNYLGSKKRTIIHTLAKEFGAINKEYYNGDIQLSFEFSNNNFYETYKKQKHNFENFAKMFSVFDDVIDSAVGVEVHNNINHNFDPTLDNVFVLMSAYQDGDDLVPVKLEVKKFKDKQNTLYVAVALEKIEMTEVLGRGNTENGVTQQPRSVNISIANIFRKINTLDKSFLKYIPDGFLNEEQLRAKKQAIQEANDSDYMSAVKRGDMVTAQRMVDEAAKAAGYTDNVYHGTKAFGFTEFDTEKSDDKRSLFAAGSTELAQTYSGKHGIKKLSDIKNIDGLSNEEVAEMLNKEASESYEGAELKTEYEIFTLKDVNNLITEVNDGIDGLQKVIDIKVKEYADKMAIDFNDKDAKTHSRLIEANELLKAYEYKRLSTPLYVLLHYTDAFRGDSNEKEIADLEYKIRLMNKLSDADTANGVIVQKDLDGYGVSIFSFDKAREELKYLISSGNYALYGKPGKQLVIDAKGQNWNNIKNWIQSAYHSTQDTYVKKDDNYYRLYDSNTDEQIFHGRIEINDKNDKMSIDAIHPIMVQKANNNLYIRSEYMRTTRDISKFAKDEGFDSVKFENLVDNGGAGASVEASDVYVYFNPSDLKSADPVTYDDDGNVIPLSERFNSKKSDIRYSRKKAPAAGEVLRDIANVETLKVYERADAERIVNSVVGEVLNFESGEFAAMSDKSYKEAVGILWDNINKVRGSELKKGAEAVADYIITNSVVHDWLEESTVAEKMNNALGVQRELGRFLHRIKFSESLRAEIKHRYDDKTQSIYSRWSARSAEASFTPDEIIGELRDTLAGYGFTVDTDNEADIFFAIHDAYVKAGENLKSDYELYLKESIEKKEYDRLKADIVKKILELREEGGKESALAEAKKKFEREVREAKNSVERMKLHNRLIAKVDAFKDLTMGRFENANVYKTDLFKGSVEHIKSIVRGGLLSVKKIRETATNLVQWYSAENPVIGDENFDADIYAKLSRIADGGVSDYAGKTIDVREVIEQFRHRFDLSSIKDELKSLYDYSKIWPNWGIQKGYEAISIRDAAKLLNELGVNIYGDELELFVQIEQMYAGACGPLTIDNLRDLIDVVAYFTKFIKNFNKIWKNGKYIEAKPVAEKYLGIMQKNKTLKVGWLSKLLSGRFAQHFFRPTSIARRMDFYEKGFYTEMLESFREGAINASNYEYEMSLAIQEFASKHKNYFRELSKRKITYNGQEMSVDTAMSLYMTSKRGQAQGGLALSGFKYEDGKDVVNINGYTESKRQSDIELGAENMRRRLSENFTATDKQFIEIAEKIFNEDCKQLKHRTDMDTKGYSNTLEDYYYPIKRAFVAKSVDSDFEDLMGRASNQGFNKDTVKGARGALCIMPLTDVLRRHVKGVAQYGALASVVRNYDTLYNLNLSDNANDPISVAREGETVWKQGADYMKKLLSDIQGVGKKQSAFLGVLRGNYATFQLGANPKTWVSQLSSFLASTSILDFQNVIAGMGVSASDVDEYCTLAKLREANNDAIFAQANANKPGLFEKRTKAGEFVSRVGEALMLPIGKVDRFVIKRLFGACQLQVQKEKGLKVGTVENKKEAGKLLEKVIIGTQQNAFATERSAAMRSDNEIFKSLTMFSADAMNVLGQVIDSFAEVSVLKQKLSKTTDAKDKADIEAALKVAGKNARKSLFALVSSAAFMGIIAVIFSRIVFGREPEEDETVLGEFAANTVGNLIGGLPIWRDAYSYFVDGYEVNNYLYAVLNDTLEAAESIFEMSKGAVAGNIDKRDIALAVRKAFYSSGQLLGVPTRNVYNVSRGVVSWFSDSATYKLDDLFYKQSYSADLAKAIEDEDEDMIATITGIMTGERVGSITDKKSLEVMNKLAGAGQDVIPREIGDTMTVDGVEYSLTNTQKGEFKTIYGDANEALADLVKLKGFDKASEDVQAKAIKRVYDTYYQLAQVEVLGTAQTKATLFSKVIDVEELALIVAYANSIEADTDKSGKTISGSRRLKIERYVQSLGCTAAEKYMIMGYLGYKNKNGEERVKSLISRYRLPKAERDALLKYCGY